MFRLACLCALLAIAASLYDPKQMTLSEALHVVPKMSSDLQQMIQNQLLSTKAGSFLHRKNELKASGANKLAVDKSKAGNAKARKMLNDLIEDAMTRLENERLRCKEEKEAASTAIWQLRSDISMFTVKATGARARIIAAQTLIEFLEPEITKTKEKLKDKLKDCKNRTLTLEGELHTLALDKEVLGNVVNLTSCDNGAVTQLISLNSSIVTCAPVKNGKCIKHLSFVTFGEQRIREKVKELRSVVATRSLERSLKEMIAQSGVDLTKTMLPCDANTEVIPGAIVPEEKCSVSTLPDCPKMRAKFEHMRTETIDSETLKTQELNTLTAECELAERTLNGQITDLETRLSEQQEELAAATKLKIESETSARVKTEELKEAMTAWGALCKECDETITGIEGELCGLRVIRQEIYKLSSMQKFVTDCVTSDWEAGECSASCNGGIKEWTRTIVNPPEMGAPCGELHKTEVCNTHTCPIDCVMSDWSGWSKCSAECNEGVMERSRHVVTPSQHGGEECGAATDTVSCNMQACDKDCELSDWSAWGACDKECGGGKEERRKTITAVAEGSGACWGPEGKERYQGRRCNMQDCIPDDTGILTCESKLDVVLLLDASGSMGEDGFQAVKDAAATLVTGFSSNTTKIAAIKFSGPYEDWGWMCEHYPQWMSDDDCGINVLTDNKLEAMTADHAAVKAQIAATTWDARTTFLSRALATTGDTLRQGRKDAQSVVIILTDGNPNLKTRVDEMTSRLKGENNARLMFVPIGPYVTIENVNEWASFPYEDNVISVADFETLAKHETINKIVQGACFKVRTKTDCPVCEAKNQPWDVKCQWPGCSHCAACPQD